MQYFLSKKCSHLFAFLLSPHRLSPLAFRLSPHRLIAFRLIALSPYRLSPFAFVGYSAQKTVYHSEVVK